ncbi:MAG: guanylate kinase [Rickettsiales bacterium]|nr:MAG: guanylate kinase [Rickettsiales bacterium]
MNYEHFVIVLSSPSGTGKSTLTKKLLEKYSNIKLSTSATTRAPREGEVDGFHYHFITQEDFDKRVANNEFLENAGVFGKSYGTLKSDVQSKFDNGNDVLLDIDWQGALNVTKQETNRKKLVKIFILPPSINELRQRLEGRGTDSREVIDKRMDDAQNTISHYNEYDYVLVNDNLDVCFEKLCSIIESKRVENENLNDLIKNLLEE